jgi:hypothetical protein
MWFVQWLPIPLIGSLVEKYPNLPMFHLTLLFAGLCMFFLGSVFLGLSLVFSPKKDHQKIIKGAGPFMFWATALFLFGVYIVLFVPFVFLVKWIIFYF